MKSIGSIDSRFGFARVASLAGLWRLVRLAWTVARERRQLAELDPRLLRDIGLTDGDARREYERHPWDLPQDRTWMARRYSRAYLMQRRLD